MKQRFLAGAFLIGSVAASHHALPVYAGGPADDKFMLWQQNAQWLANPAGPITKQADQAVSRFEDAEAMRLYNKALKINPKFAPALRNRGKLFVGTGKFKEALADFSAAMKDGPVYQYLAGRDRAETNVELRNWKAAEADYSTLINTQYKSQGLYSGRAQCYMGMNEPAKAVADLNIAAKLKPGRTLILRKRARAAYDAKMYDLALADCNYVIENDATGESSVRNNVDLYEIRANIYQKQGKLQLARNDRKFVLSKQAENLEVAPFSSTFGKKNHDRWAH